MSVDNLDGNGLADQPSLIYGYTDDTDELHIRELSRSGYGEPGPSPGDVIERETTKSTLEDGLPDLDIPGQDGVQYEDCGDDVPAFACEDCGSPIYVGRTCANPLCSRGWAAAVKSKTVRTAGKLWAMQQVLNHRHHENIDHNHVVASMPDFLVDSDDPLDRALLVLKTLLKEHWGIESFVAIYHPKRIKQEYRKDQYEHGGEPGEGDMTWKDVLSSDNPDKYTKHSPHFHLFFPAKRRQFDYSVVKSVQAQSGWSFHRITKGGQNSDSNVSVEDLDDLVHQLTYCFSHAGVQQVAGRHELTSRLKGEIHNLYVPDDITDEILAKFCNAAPKLLGVTFANVANATCDAEVSVVAAEDENDSGAETAEPTLPGRTHPIEDLYDHDDKQVQASTPDPRSMDAPVPAEGSSQDNRGPTAVGMASGESPPTAASAESSEGNGGSAPVQDDRGPCGGDVVPMHEARTLINDAEWCAQAEHVSGLRTAVQEWESLSRGDDDLPWIGGDGTVIEPD